MTKPAVALASPVADARAGRLTPNDRIVLSCLEQRNVPMKAYELLESLRNEGINAPMTVYRALSRLCEKGRVRKIESINAYYALPEPEKGEVGAFLLCQQCEAVGFQHLSKSTISELVSDVEVLDAAIELRTGCLSGRGPLFSGSCPKRAANGSAVN